MNVHPPKDESVETHRGGTAKFTFRSGERPLEGYTIKRGVGRGGFGEVYFGTSDAGKEVALKLIRRNLDVELRGATQCLNLKHPNLINLYDIRTDEDGDQWVIMEYVTGESLDEVIDRHPDGLPVDQAIWWMHGICAGVAYLHDHGIVHRDLKPGNIFSDGGMVKVGDYGLAKFISCSRRSGQTESVGTVHYMAPEISNGRYGREIDTYALGIMLFELLTGSVPFEGESVGEVLMKHLTAEPELDKLDEPFRDIVRRALAKDPDVRLKSVAEFASLLPGGEGVATPIPEAYAVNVELEPVPDEDNGTPHGATAPYAQAAEAANPHAADSNTTDLHVDEEPIYAAVRDGWNHCEHAWHEAELHPVLRGIIIVAVVVTLIYTVPAWLTALFTAFFLYAIYYAIRGLLLQTNRAGGTSAARRRAPHAVAAAVPATRAVDPQLATAHPPRNVHPQRRRRQKKSWQARVATELAQRPLHEKLSELFGAMLLSALVAMLIGLVAWVVVPGGGIALHVWLTLIGTLGSWAVVIPTKLSEGSLEDHVPMRFTLLILGAALGAAAYGLGGALLPEIPYFSSISMDPGDAVADQLFGMSGGVHPTLPASMAYFAFLFVILRWWKQAEFARHRRLSVWSVAACLFWAYCLHFFWWFPQPAGMMVAGVIAVSTQLASPWLLPSRRRELAGEVQAA